MVIFIIYFTTIVTIPIRSLNIRFSVDISARIFSSVDPKSSDRSVVLEDPLKILCNYGTETGVYKDKLTDNT